MQMRVWGKWKRSYQVQLLSVLQGENGATLTSAGRSVLSRGGTALQVGSQQGAEGNN